MYPFLFHYSSFLFLFLALISIKIPIFSCAVDPRYMSCGLPFNCGNLKDISCPFWGSNRPNHCGRPEFELTCLDKIPRISISSNTYRVLEMNQDVRILKVAREDFWDVICPSHLSNTTLNFSLFTFGAGLTNLSLFYGCSFSVMLPQLFGPIACDINSTSNVYVATREIRIEPRVGSCNSGVFVPVFESVAQGVEVRNKTISDALDEGFELRWQIGGDQVECERCEISGGRCGFNSSESRFVCFCLDQPNATCSNRPVT